MNSPLERREIRLRGLLPRVPGASIGSRAGGELDSSVARTVHAEADCGACAPSEDRLARAMPGGNTGSGRAGAWDAAHRRAAESAQADCVKLLRRIYSLMQAGAELLVSRFIRPERRDEEDSRAKAARPLLHPNTAESASRAEDTRHGHTQRSRPPARRPRQGVRPERVLPLTHPTHTQAVLNLAQALLSSGELLALRCTPAGVQLGGAHAAAFGARGPLRRAAVRARGDERRPAPRRGERVAGPLSLRRGASRRGWCAPRADWRRRWRRRARRAFPSTVTGCSRRTRRTPPSRTTARERVGGLDDGGIQMWNAHDMYEQVRDSAIRVESEDTEELRRLLREGTDGERLTVMNRLEFLAQYCLTHGMIDRGIGAGAGPSPRRGRDARPQPRHPRDGDAGHPPREHPRRDRGAGAAAGQGAHGRGAHGAALHPAARGRRHGDAAGARAGGRHGRLRAARLPRRAGGAGPRGRAAAGGHDRRRALVRGAQHGRHPGRDPQRRRGGALSPHRRALRRPRAPRDHPGARPRSAAKRRCRCWRRG